MILKLCVTQFPIPTVLAKPRQLMSGLHRDREINIPSD